MQEPYEEGVASHLGPESCAVGRKAAGEALTGARTDAVLSCEITHDGVPPLSKPACGYTGAGVTREPETDPAQSKTRCTSGTSSRGTWEIPRASGGASRPDRSGKAKAERLT